MMQLKDFVLSVCFAAVAISVIDMLMPSGKMKGVMKTVTGAFFLLTVLMPVTSGISIGTEDVYIEKSSYEQIDSLYSAVMDRLETGTREHIEAEIAKIATELGITQIKIEINMDRTQDRRISINKADIYIGKEELEKAGLLEEKVRKELGIDIFVQDRNNL